MKKLGLYLIPLLALGLLASCEEDPFKGISQENPQEEMVKPCEVQVSEGSGISGTSLDLNKYVDQNIPVVSVAEIANLPAGSNVAFKMELASKEDFSDAAELDLVGTEVSANDWSNEFRLMYGRSPKARTNYVRFKAYIVEGDNVYRIGSVDTYYCSKQLEVTPIDLGVKIESAYYLIGTCNGWNPEALDDWKFDHSDADVYDDPTFTIEVEVTQEQIDANSGWWWKIVPQSNVDAGNVWALGILGVPNNGDSSLTGYLTDKPNEGSNEVGAGCIMDAGKYKLIINMEEGTYEFADNSLLYAVGDGSGWGFDDYKCQKLFAWGGGYVGYTYIQSQVKFTTAPDWSHGDYGMGEVPGTLAFAGANIWVDAPGLYFARVNLEAMTYELTNIQSVGLIGDFNSWASEEAMTPDETFLVWTGTLTLEEAGGWKFRMNNDWGINLGGTEGNLVPDGGNITCEPGTYTVTLDLRTLPLTCTIK